MQTFISPSVHHKFTTIVSCLKLIISFDSTVSRDYFCVSPVSECRLELAAHLSLHSSGSSLLRFCPSSSLPSRQSRCPHLSSPLSQHSTLRWRESRKHMCWCHTATSTPLASSMLSSLTTVPTTLILSSTHTQSNNETNFIRHRFEWF